MCHLAYMVSYKGVLCLGGVESVEAEEAPVPAIGPTELVIILAIILLFFGARRVPELGRALGNSIQEFRKGARDGDGKQQLSDQDSERGSSLEGSEDRRETVRDEAPAPRS
jgi:sec-independent protein translocase protein TatA